MNIKLTIYPAHVLVVLPTRLLFLFSSLEFPNVPRVFLRRPFFCLTSFYSCYHFLFRSNSILSGMSFCIAPFVLFIFCLYIVQIPLIWLIRICLYSYTLAIENEKAFFLVFIFSARGRGEGFVIWINNHIRITLYFSNHPLDCCFPIDMC